ncbi:MAG: hypothetical protein PHV16_01770 [Candidatus Nanoarchaeia archaeon]|nr:hypothetical protein [Candidatus Nanoarchaeia archaeon]
MKKAQIQGQVFVYILTLIITAAILIFGYSSVRNIMDKANQVEMTNFKAAIKSDFQSMSSDYGSAKTYTYNVPSGVKEVCFYRTGIDPNYRAMPYDLNPLIRDSINDDTGNNFFLIFGDETIDQMNLGKIEIEEQVMIICIEPSGSRIKVTLEGLGDGVSISRA